MKSPNKSEQDKSNPAINYQLSILSDEILYIQNIFDRIDKITQTTKNWAVITWASSISIFITNNDLNKFILYTTLLPILFWFIDAHWRHLQRRSGYRLIQINKFINSDSLHKSFKKGRLINFSILDPVGTQYKYDKKYKEYCTIRRTLWYKEIIIFYSGMIIISVIIGILSS